MKQTIKILLAFLLVSCQLPLSGSLRAQDAEYQLIRRTYTINSDGSIDMRFRKEIKLLRNRAITAYADKGETFIIYNPAFDILTINESYTIRKDGSQVQTPANAFIDQLPSECVDCGRYNGVRERVVVHTALEYDCIVVLDYTIHHKGNSGWDETLDLVMDCPVKKHEVIIDAAPGQKMEATLLNGNSKTKEVNDGHAYHLVASNLEQNIIENYSAMAYPQLKISLQPDRNRLTIDNRETLPEVENLIAELYDHDTMRWVVAMRDYVADYVHTVGLPMRYFDYRCSSASKTFNSNCGTIEEKTLLLAAMLRQAGLSAETVVPENHIEVAIPEQGVPMTYRLSLTSKRPPRLEGAAIDDQRTITTDRELPWKGQSIGGCYAQMQIPTEEGSISINPAWLTSSRKSPLRVRNCNESHHYTVVLPGNSGLYLVKPVTLSYTKKGIGSLKIVIRQLENGTIDVVRELNIDLADGIVTTKQYKDFRKMMQDWKHYSVITLRDSRCGNR